MLCAHADLTLPLRTAILALCLWIAVTLTTPYKGIKMLCDSTRCSRTFTTISAWHIGYGALAVCDVVWSVWRYFCFFIVALYHAVYCVFIIFFVRVWRVGQG